MKKILALLLAAVLLFSLCGCSLLSELAEEYLPDQEAVESLLEVSSAERPLYYDSHPEIPDFGAAFDYVLYAKTPSDGFDYYYYEIKTDDPAAEFAQARSDYAALCTELGYPPDYSVSGSLSLLVRFVNQSALLAVIETEDAVYICLIAADTRQMNDAMDSMQGVGEIAEAADWQGLYARYAAELAAGTALIPASAEGDLTLAQLGEDMLAQSVAFFESDDTRQAFRDAGYAVDKVTAGSGYGTPYIEGKDAAGITTRFSLQCSPEDGTACLTVQQDGSTLLSVFILSDGQRCIKQVYDARQQRLVRVWIENGSLALGADSAPEAPAFPDITEQLSLENFIYSCRSYVFYP